MRLVGCLLILLLLAGCLSSERPAPVTAPTTSPADARESRMDDGAGQGPSGGPPVETTQHHEGKVVLRPASGGVGYMESGDPASFCFMLPTNVTLLRGVFSYSPRQQAGYEFRSTESGKGNGSWGADDPTSYAPESPITLDYTNPENGRWVSYGGPGSVGGEMDWRLDLTMVTQGTPSAKVIEDFETIDPSC